MKKTILSVATAFALFMSTLGLTHGDGGAERPVQTATVTADALTRHVPRTASRSSQDRLLEVPKKKVVTVIPAKPHPKPVVKPKPVKKAPTYTLSILQKRIRGCESGSGPNSPGDYRAQNPRSSASGAYQFLDGTWQSASHLPGRAKDYPPAVQDRVFLAYFAKVGTSPWRSSRGCWG